jgi:hypothetical protein
MAIGGSAYLTYSFATFLAPSVAARLVPSIQLPSLIGELSLCLYLVAGRVNATRWRERAGATTVRPFSVEPSATA